MISLIQPYNELLLLMTVILGVINAALLLALLIKKIRLEKQTKAVASKIVAGLEKDEFMSGPTIFNVRGIVDGGVLIALIGVAMVAFISGRETVSKEAVVNKEEIKIDNSVYQCVPIRRKMIKYYDVETGRYKFLPLPNECKR